jgi:NhaA family Na+:H+ antiporter
LVLLICTALSLSLTNSGLGMSYSHFWHSDILNKPVEFWINDGLMTVFFLLVGLEIEREFYIGELAVIKQAMLPVLAAVGGMAVPAIIHFAFNNGLPTQNGFGIPMATDIAFCLGILSLLGKRVPGSLKVFLAALAIIDDLGAILIIALFYSKGITIVYLGVGALIFSLMIVFNRIRLYKTWVYLLMGCFLWFCLYRAGIHPTITGILLAFALPFGKGDERSLSYKLQHRLHPIVAFGVLPLFALANTAIVIPSSFIHELTSPNSMGIILGLTIGKPLGIFLFAVSGIALGLCSLPDELRRSYLLGASFLAGIGFTMSVFITLLAFDDSTTVELSKIAVIVGSTLAGIIGYIWLRVSLNRDQAGPKHGGL